MNGLGGGPLAIGDLTQRTPASDTLRILVGDSRQVLGQIAPGTVQCCVTLPLYWGLRDYDHGDQIGAEPSVLPKRWGFPDRHQDRFQDREQVPCWRISPVSLLNTRSQQSVT